MKKLLLPICLLLLSLTGLAQPSSPAPINLDSLWAVRNDPNQADTNRFKALNKIIWEGRYIFTHPDSALYFAQLNFDLAEEKGNKKWMAMALNTKGTVFTSQGNHDKAVEYFSQSLAINEAIGEKKESIHNLVNIGIAYQKKYDFGNGSQYLIRAVKLSEAIGYTDVQAKSFNLLAAMFAQQGDLDQALQYYLQEKAIYEKTGFKKKLAGNALNLGGIAIKQGRNAEAIAYFQESLRIYQELGSKMRTAGPLSNLGHIYFKEKEYDRALSYFNQTLALFEKRNIKPGIATELSKIGDVYLAKGDYATALPYFERALPLVRGGGFGVYRSISTPAKGLYTCYKATGQYQKALEMYELHIEVRDSLEKKSNSEALIRNQSKYEYEKQKVLDDLENEKEQAQQRLISWGIGLVLLLSLIVAGGIFNRLRITRKQKRMIEEQRQRAERSERYKEQFLANMSHEIRTPMHAISGMVKILERNAHPDTQDVYLDAMHISADNLLVLLNDILDLSKIEAGKLDVENIPMQPAKVMENVSQLLKFKAAEKGLQLEVNIAPDVPNWIMGDPTRLNQILINLAGNAIKFTPKGSVKLSVKRKNDFLLYEVKDTGVGIAEEKRTHIFEAFEQADDSTTRHYGGTGLGLNISRQLVELQSGNIWTESVVGQGSSFFVSLPLMLAEEAATASIELTQAQFDSMAAALKGTRILLAEDNEFNQMILLDDLGYFVKDIHIEVAENGAIAWEKFQNGDYDLILMDVQMPEMDGYETTLKIRDWEKGNGKEPIPIIAMTASLLNTEVNLCFEAGMDNYIPKPYEMEELIGRIYAEVKKNE